MLVQVRMSVMLAMSAISLAVVAVVGWLAFGTQISSAAPVAGESTTVQLDTTCRAFDTRTGVDNVGPRATPIGDSETFVVDMHGAVGDCVIPSTATGLIGNLTAINATAATNLRVFPAGGALPLTSVSNPRPGTAPLANAVNSGLSASGELAVFNNAGTVDVIFDISAYTTSSTLTDLETRLVGLEASNAELVALLDGVTRQDIDGADTLQFSAMNLQIVSGTGTTDGVVNGVGNLIVGYNEIGVGDDRTGSHNLIVGAAHSYNNYGGVVFGFNNNISGTSASVTGGRGNEASGGESAVTGGVNNDATGGASSVAGGNANTASGNISSAIGGVVNEASGERSTVSGGQNSVASGNTSSVSGGLTNAATGDRSSVSGGYENVASGDQSSVTGGRGNDASGFRSTVTGGQGNLVQADYSVGVGGDSNIVAPNSSHAVVVGGDGNAIGFVIDGPSNVLVGGSFMLCDGAPVRVCGEGALSAP